MLSNCFPAESYCRKWNMSSEWCLIALALHKALKLRIHIKFELYLWPLSYFTVIDCSLVCLQTRLGDPQGQRPYRIHFCIFHVQHQALAHSWHSEYLLNWDVLPLTLFSFFAKYSFTYSLIEHIFIIKSLPSVNMKGNFSSTTFSV